MALPVLSRAQFNTMMALYRAQSKYPYVYGAKGPFQFDCSGLVSFVLHKIGVPIPEGTYAQEKYGIQVKVSDARPGDLIFFNTDDSTYGSDHVGIVTGNGMMFNAQNENAGIRETSYMSEYWKSRITQVRRVVDVADDANGGFDDAPQPGQEPGPIGTPSSGIENQTQILQLPAWLNGIIQSNVDRATFFFSPERMLIVAFGCVLVTIGTVVVLREPAIQIGTTAVTGGSGAIVKSVAKNAVS
jgi:hypothetical protein